MVDENSEEEGEGEGEREPQSLVEQHKANLKKKSKREMKEEQRKKEDEEKAAKEDRLREVCIKNTQAYMLRRTWVNIMRYLHCIATCQWFCLINSTWLMIGTLSIV